MTDGSSVGGHPGLSGSASGTENVPRRMSYASVASGANAQHLMNNPRSGTYAYSVATTSDNPYSSVHPEEARIRRSSQEQDTSGGSHKRQIQLPMYSRKYAGLPVHGSRQTTNEFFVPSYLKDSKYTAKLKELFVRKSRSERESTPGTHPGPASVNQNSSNVNAHRIAPSHRGMTYEVIESNPPRDEDSLLPLPTRWSEQDRYPGLDVSPDGLEVKYNGSAPKSDVEAASVRADYAMSPACGIYYFEVEIKSKSKDCAVAVGFSTAKASLERLPGWEPDSWAYHGDDGKTFSGEHNGRSYSQTFTAGDIIGCGINFNTGQAFFTKNGSDLGVAFREIKNMTPFPCVGIKKYSGAVVRVNFGQDPFLFDINEKVAQETTIVDAQIRRTKTNSLHPNLDETSLVQKLVSQFLMHGGYVETSKAFEEEVKREKRSLGDAADTASQSMSDIDSTHAANRQQIRRAVLAGDIDIAIELTNNYYPRLLQTSPDITFHLKCRKWVELISKAADLRSRQTITADSRSAGKTANVLAKSTTSSEAVEDVFDQQMEIDEEQQAVVPGTGKAPVISSSRNAETDMAYNQLMTQAMEYGQTLQREYRNEKKGDYNKTLQNIFSLIVYDEPRESVYGHLLYLDGRVKVSEELNSAILVMLGRPPTAALENIYKQTEALLDVLSTEGGPASFVNLQVTFDER